MALGHSLEPARARIGELGAEVVGMGLRGDVVSLRNRGRCLVMKFGFEPNPQSNPSPKPYKALIALHSPDFLKSSTRQVCDSSECCDPKFRASVGSLLKTPMPQTA